MVSWILVGIPEDQSHNTQRMVTAAAIALAAEFATSKEDCKADSTRV